MTGKKRFCAYCKQETTNTAKLDGALLCRKCEREILAAFKK